MTKPLRGFAIAVLFVAFVLSVKTATAIEAVPRWSFDIEVKHGTEKTTETLVYDGSTVACPTLTKLGVDRLFVTSRVNGPRTRWDLAPNEKALASFHAVVVGGTIEGNFVIRDAKRNNQTYLFSGKAR